MSKCKIDWNETVRLKAKDMYGLVLLSFVGAWYVEVKLIESVGMACEFLYDMNEKRKEKKE